VISLQTCPETVIDGSGVTFCGRVFHSRKAASGKARSPTVERRVRRTTSADGEAMTVFLYLLYLFLMFVRSCLCGHYSIYFGGNE